MTRNNSTQNVLSAPMTSDQYSRVRFTFSPIFHERLSLCRVVQRRLLALANRERKRMQYLLLDRDAQISSMHRYTEMESHAIDVSDLTRLLRIIAHHLSLSRNNSRGDHLVDYLQMSEGARAIKFIYLPTDGEDRSSALRFRLFFTLARAFHVERNIPRYIESSILMPAARTSMLKNVLPLNFPRRHLPRQTRKNTPVARYRR